MIRWLILGILCLCIVAKTHAQGCVNRIADCTPYAAGCSNPVIQSYCPATCKNSLRDSQTTCALYQSRCSEFTVFSLCMRTCCFAVSGWAEWSDWGECSTTCGDGEQTRTRTCQGGSCPGRNSRTRSCNKGKCGGWTSWGGWSSCSKTCGPGRRTRSRTCTDGNCPGSKDAEENCNVEECPVWSDWSDWSRCSKTCGSGTRTKTRTCTAGKCTGPTSQQDSCFETECKYDAFGPWTNWGGCSTTCGGGTASRTRTCPGQCNGHSAETRLCREEICPITKCEDSFSICSVYVRLCSFNENVRTSCRRTCNACDQGPTTPWGEFGPCSVTCGTGTKRRTKGNVEQQITCGNTPCAGDPASWGVWSYGECSVTCGGGTQEMTRTCSVPGKCVGSSKDSRPCATGKCEAVWNDWEDWQQCSKTCGTGSQTRTRTCKSGECGSETSETRKCNEQECAAVWNDWQDWKECSATCGQGTQQRERTCKSGNCGEDTTEQRNCNIEACPKWNKWGDWEKCSETCGGGQRSRTRTCSVKGKCKGSNSQTETCNEKACPEWKKWTEWGKCSKPCGGQRTRTRECTVVGKCVGQNSETEDCNGGECGGDWGSWKSWSDCSYTCGHGERKRTRDCNLEKCDKGVGTETEACNTQPCENPSSGSWSRCSLTCGWGTRYKILENGTQIFETCAKYECPRRPCPGAYRYEVQDSCCTETGHQPGEISCGQPVVGGRIIGGKDAEAGQWPWMMALHLVSRASFCGGVLISSKWGLSAGHCFIRSSSGVWYDYSDWMAYTGVSNVSDIWGGKDGIQSSGIETAIMHPNHKYPKADIILLKFKGSFTHNGNTQPLCLPGGERTPQDSTCYVAGWGISDLDNPSITNRLQEVGIRNLDMEICKNAYGQKERFKKLFEEDTDKLICAGSLHRSVDSCRGDSGGPLMCQSCSSCTWYLAGVVSFGAIDCGKIGVPGVYTKVKTYEDWILRITGIPTRSVPQCPWRYGSG